MAATRARAVGTLILAASGDDLLLLARSRPNSDSFLPAEYREWLGPAVAATQAATPVAAGHRFLLSSTAIAGGLVSAGREDQGRCLGARYTTR